MSDTRKIPTDSSKLKPKESSHFPTATIDPDALAILANMANSTESIGQQGTEEFITRENNSRPEPIIGNDGIPRTVYHSGLNLPDISDGRVQVIEEPNRTTVTLHTNAAKITSLKNELPNQHEGTYSLSERSDELRFRTTNSIKGKVTIRVFEGEDVAGRQVDTFDNIVQLEFPADIPISKQSIVQYLNLEENIGDSTQQADNRNREQYSLQNKEEPGSDTQFELRQIFPGYEVPTLPVRDKLLTMNYGPFFFSHAFIGIPPQTVASNLIKIIASGGLLSLNERYKRHLFSAGSSPTDDFRTGGANYVFTNLVTENHSTAMRGPIELVMSPSLANRIDWFSYPNDAFGSNPIKHIESTETPEEAIQRLTKEDTISGEQFFRYGISLEDILNVACSSNRQRALILQELLAQGITEVNGKPIDKWVVIQRTYADTFSSLDSTKSQLATDEKKDSPITINSFTQDKSSGSDVYVEKESTKKYSIQTFPDQAQASCSYISNKIYELCGMNVLGNKLVRMPDNSLALASELNPAISRNPNESRKNELRKWLIPICFLLDWNTFYQEPSIDGHNRQDGFYLTNQNNTLLFDGHGVRKSEQDLNMGIEQEISILQQGNSEDSSESSFPITDHDIRTQIQAFLMLVGEGDIHTIIDDANFSNNNDKIQVLNLLLSRRKALQEMVLD